MKEMAAKFSFLTLLTIFTFTLYAQDDIAKIEDLLDQWHQAAANADQQSYFDFIAEDGVYIGTDATENWTKAEFYEWSMSYFENGKAWSFKATERNIYFSKDKSIVWFDEQLEYSGGVLRGSGVLVKENNNWKLAHYVLSLPVPNDKFKEVIEVMNQTNDKENMDNQE